MNSSSSDVLQRVALWAFLAVLALATIVLSVVVGPVGAIVPFGALLFAFILSRVPLRWPLFVVMAMCLVLDNPADRGPWKSPLFLLGSLMTIQLKKTLPVGALILTGAETVLVLMVALYWARRARGNTLDLAGGPRAPKELYYIIWLSLCGTLFAAFWGLSHGGIMKWANWQMDRQLRLPLWCMFCAVVFRGSKDIVPFGRFIIGAASVRAIMAVGVRRAFPETETCTSHGDSVLFAVAVLILLNLVLEEPSRANLQRMAVFLPLLVLGMIANDRRIVWPNIVLGGVFAFFLTRWSVLKLKLVRAGIASVPLALVYVAIGWNSGSKVFKPVQLLRSIVDAKSDGSSNWRELENFNLHQTFIQNPLLGIGLGKPFNEVVKLPAVPYDLEPYLPHNSILGLWAFTGWLGFTCIWMLLALGVYFGVRTYRSTTVPLYRVASVSLVATLVVCMLQAFGDMGFGGWPWTFTLAPGLAIVAKLAIETGAWRHSNGRLR